MKDKRRTKNNNLEFLIGWRGFPDPKDDTWEPLGHLSGSEHMIREFNEQWEKDYVRKTAETLETQTVRRKRTTELNSQREDIDEVMGEGGGDEEEDGESEDGYEDGHGTGGADKRSGTQRRKLHSFYFRTGAVVQSVRKNIREDMEDRWVTNLSEDRKRFYLVSSLLDPHTKILSFCDNKYFPKSWKDYTLGYLSMDLESFYVWSTQGEEKDSDGQADPLMWWKQHQQEFPDLARMTRQYLTVPVTSKSPERFFSLVGLVQTDLCGRLLDTTMIDLMWVKQAP